MVLFSTMSADAEPSDSLLRTPLKKLEKSRYMCGVSAEYFKSLSRSTGFGSASFMISGSSFPSTAIDTCGKFRVFYVDKAISTGKGFDDSSVGLSRRNVVCEVLNYIQSVLDFSSIPSGQYIRLYVDTSLSSLYPAPIPTTFYARAGAFFSSSSTGVVNGYIHQFVTSGIDPASISDYHAEMKVNFDKVHILDDTGAVKDSSYLIFNDSIRNVNYCELDLYSTVLHEITHTLGWSSMLTPFSVSTASTRYTSIDTVLHLTDISTSMTTLRPAFSGGKLSYTSSSKIYWINNKFEPNNYPIYLLTYYFSTAKWATSFAHLDDG